MGLLNSNSLNQWLTQTIPQNARNLWGEIKQAPQDMRNMFTPETYKKTMDAYHNPKNGALDKDKAMAMAMDFLQTTNPVAGLLAHTVYHGSPHKFNKFDMSKIGTGEGAQAYGHGLYMAESPEVAAQYQKNLSGYAEVNGKKLKGGIADRNSSPERLAEILLAPVQNADDFAKAYETAKTWRGGDAAKVIDEWKNTGALNFGDSGALYKVDIPDEAIPRMLDWDKPLSKQPEAVRNAFKAKEAARTDKVLQQRLATRQQMIADGKPTNIIDRQIEVLKDEFANPTIGDMTGGEYHNYLYRQLGKADDISGWLKDAGIPGIRYLDGSSRNVGEGTSNFVLFDDQLPRILEINGQPTGLLSYADEAKKAKGGLLDTGEIGFKDIRQPKENVNNVAASYSTSAKVVGNDTVPIESLKGGVGKEIGDNKRVDDLVNKLSQENSYLERLIVDDAGNVIEGQHRLDALRKLGVKNVPVVVVKDYSRGFPMQNVSSAISKAQKMPSDNANQLTSHLAEIFADEKGNLAEIAKYEIPKGYEKAWVAGIKALGKKK